MAYYIHLLFVGEKRQIEIGLQLELYSKRWMVFWSLPFLYKKQNFDFTTNEIYR